MNKKYFKMLIITLLFTTSCYASNINSYQTLSKEYNIDEKILELWSQSKNSIEYSIEMLKNSPIELYFIGSESFNILNYSFIKKRYLLTDELLQLYLKTLPYINKDNKYTIYHLMENVEKSNINVEEPIYIWKNKNGDEELLSSVQFLFVISFAINKITDIPIKKRSNTMKKFVKTFYPILLNHYKRWVLGVQERGTKKIVGSFDRRGWGCKDKTGNYIYARTLNQMIEELGKKSYHGASYCNVITDPSLLIVSGLGYYLSSSINHKDNKSLNNFFIKSIDIISKRFKKEKIKISNNQEIPILTFQNGAWYGHPNYNYSDYNGSTFPKDKDKKSNISIGIDVSHGSRVLSFLEMLIENKNKFNINFPTQNDMKMFTDAFFYKVFNQDFKNPLFKNYMNGSNGWFRVNYDSRQGYGYEPYKNGSVGALLGGYPILAQYNRDLEKIFITLFKKLNSTKKEDREFIHNFYEKSIWIEGKEREVYQFYQKKVTKKTAIFLINFYSSLI